MPYATGLAPAGSWVGWQRSRKSGLHTVEGIISCCQVLDLGFRSTTFESGVGDNSVSMKRYPGLDDAQRRCCFCQAADFLGLLQGTKRIREIAACHMLSPFSLLTSGGRRCA